MARQRMTENKLARKDNIWYGNIYVCGRKLGRFRRPENNIRWLVPSNIFQKKGGEVIWSLCAYSDKYNKYCSFFTLNFSIGKCQF